MEQKIHDMEPIEIKIKMLRLGLKQTQIAKKVGVTRRAIGMTIDGHSASHRLRVAIAEAIGIDIKEIWPSVYTTGGPRGKGRPKKDQSRI